MEASAFHQDETVSPGGVKREQALYEKVLTDIKKHVQSWKECSPLHPHNIQLTRLSGLSNACYRVKILPETGPSLEKKEKLAALEPQMLLYRLFECAIVDWNMENEIFQSLSDQDLGPKLYFQNNEYRIEGFFLSRPITIFEMRNQIFIEAYARKICDFNYNVEARKKVEKYLPMTKLYIDECFDTWHPEVIKRMPSIRKAYESNKSIQGILDLYEKTFLFEGAIEHFKKLVPYDSEVVLAHNDAQENNILANLDDLTHVIFIDFEYTSWNPRAMDIANYFNETMLDNAHPVGSGIKWYLQNFINKEEQDKLMRIYLDQYFTTYSDQKEKVEKNVFIEESMPKLRSEVNRCLQLNNYFWAIWSMRILKEEKLGDPSVFNFDFALARVEMFNHVKKVCPIATDDVIIN